MPEHVQFTVTPLRRQVTSTRPDDEHERPAAGEPATEQFIGARDLTRWSRPLHALPEVGLRLGRYVSANVVLLVTSAIGAFIAVLLTWATEEIYDSIKASNGLARLDQPALDWAVSVRTPANVAVAQVLTNLGGAVGLTIITVAIIVTMSIRWRSRTPFVLLAIGTAGSLLMTAVGKDLVGRSRPPHSAAVPPYETSPAFPSGHALNNTVVACLVAYLLLLHLTSQIARTIAVTLSAVWFVAIGLTRVFLGYHWLTDVIAGWMLGLAWVAMVVTSHRIYLTVKRSKERRPAGSTTADSS